MKSLNRILSITLVLSIMVTGMVSAAPISENKLEEKNGVERLAGKTRIQTAIEASKRVYEKSNTVILVGYNGVIDALTGTILAHAKDAPVLLTLKDSVPKDVKDELKRLGAKNIIVIGGKNVVSEKVVSDLKDYSVKRIGGLNRAETAAKIAKEVNSKSNHAFLALGYEKFADALAVGPVSAINNSPVFLTQTGKIPKETLKAMQEMKITHVTIVGGESAVNKDIFKQLEGLKLTVNRISGDNREGTAISIAKKYFPKTKTFIIANGWSYADALVGGYMGAKLNASILLTQPKDLSLDTKAYLKEFASKVYVLGGKTVVSEETFNKIMEALKDDISEEQQKLKAAKEMVTKAESSKKQVDIDAARLLVNELTNGVEKDSLKARLDEVQKKIDDGSAAKTIMDKINLLPAVQNITLADRAQVKSTRTAYDGLTTTQRVLVTNLNKLEAAEAKVVDLETPVIPPVEPQEPQDLTVAKGVIDKINLLPTVQNLKLTDKAQVQAARTAYNGLTTAQKPLVNNLNKLEAAEAKMRDLEIPTGPQELVIATAAVVKAEGSKTQADVDAARILVNALPPDNAKTDLLSRLDAIVILVESSDAGLSNLTINGQTVVDFATDTLSYNVKLPAGTSVFPIIKATAKGTKATAIVSQVETFPWSATVLVTAENGITMQIYTINFTINQDQPSGLVVVEPSTPGGADGKITGTTTDMEYKLSGDVTWIPVTGTEITGLPSGYYDVRYAAKTGYNEGLPVTIGVQPGPNKAQEAPTGLVGVAPTTFGAANGKITGTTTAMEYRLLPDGIWIAVTGTEITGLIVGGYDVRYAAKPGFDAGIAATTQVPAPVNQGQNQPTEVLIGVAPTTIGGTDGKITGATTAMEYRLLPDGIWIAATGTEIIGLAAGYYDVRYAAKDGLDAGSARTIGVPSAPSQNQGSPTEVLIGVAPTTLGGSDGKITGTTTAMEYLLAGIWTPVTGTEITGLAVGWYDVRYAAKPGYNEGIAATIGVPQIGNQTQAAPTTLSMVAPTTFRGANGKIIGATSAMEYRALADLTWTAVTGTEITGLPAGYYYVRYAAKLGYDASEDTSVQIKEAEATLNAVTIDGVSLAGFAPNKLAYDIQLLAGTVSIPIVMASALDGNAPVVISAATSLPGETTILVIAQDGITSKTYTINFILANQSPVGLIGVAPTTAGGSDGKITGTTNQMEYKLTAAANWIPVTGTQIIGLIAGSYDVRYAAKPGYNVGTSANIIVPNKSAGKLIFTFDDGWKDTITLGKTILDTAGYKATVYVNKDLTQIAEYGWTEYHVNNVMDYNDLRVLYNHGWDISNHSANHLDFKRNAQGQLVGADDQPLEWQTPEAYGEGHPELDPEIWYTEWLKTLVTIGSDPNSVGDMRKVYLDNQNWLSNSEPDGLGKLVNGVWTPGRNLNMPLGAYHVAYPSGLYSPELIAMLKGIGVETGRATIETGIKNNVANPVTDFFNLPVQYVESEIVNGNDENLVDVFESIQYAVDNGTTVILMLHRVGPAGDLFVTPESLEAIVNYAKQRTDAGTLDVMTISQWYNMMK